MNYFGMADADWGWKKRYVYKQLRCNVNKLIIIPHYSSTTLDSLIVVVHGDYFLEISPQNTSLFQWLLLLIFSSFPNTTIITLKNVNNSGQRVSKFPQNFSKCPHNTIIPLSILNIFLKSPQNTLIPQTLLLRSLEYLSLKTVFKII